MLRVMLLKGLFCGFSLKFHSVSLKRNCLFVCLFVFSFIKKDRRWMFLLQVFCYTHTLY